MLCKIRLSVVNKESKNGEIKEDDSGAPVLSFATMRLLSLPGTS